MRWVEKVKKAMHDAGRVRIGYKESMGIKDNLIFDHYRDGKLIDHRDYHNMLTIVGYAQMALLGYSAAAVPFTYMAVGTGVGAESNASIALGTEIVNHGLERAAATCTTQTTTEVDDTFQLYHLWNITGSDAITEAGVFNDNAAGTMLARKKFDALNTLSGDTLAETWKFKVTTA